MRVECCGLSELSGPPDDPANRFIAATDPVHSAELMNVDELLFDSSGHSIAKTLIESSFGIVFRN